MNSMTFFSNHIWEDRNTGNENRGSCRGTQTADPVCNGKKTILHPGQKNTQKGGSASIRMAQDDENILFRYSYDGVEEDYAISSHRGHYFHISDQDYWRQYN